MFKLVMATAKQLTSSSFIPRQLATNYIAYTFLDAGIEVVIFILGAGCLGSVHFFLSVDFQINILVVLSDICNIQDLFNSWHSKWVPVNNEEIKLVNKNQIPHC